MFFMFVPVPVIYFKNSCISYFLSTLFRIEGFIANYPNAIHNKTAGLLWSKLKFQAILDATTVARNNIVKIFWESNFKNRQFLTFVLAILSIFEIFATYTLVNIFMNDSTGCFLLSVSKL